jgi:multidrug transporter EmrE-like cation transporter
MTLKIFGMIFVALASLIEAVGQLAFKRASNESASHGALAGVHALARAPGWVLLGVACFIAEAVFYSASLRLLDLSIAFPAGSLVFVGVVVLSRRWLGEVVEPRRWAGVGLIVCGTILLGFS